MTSCPPMPDLQFAPAPCPQCGAINEDEANDKCTQTQDQTGEYSCAGEFNDAGQSIQATEASLAAMDQWIDVHHGCNPKDCSHGELEREDK